MNFGQNLYNWFLSNAQSLVLMAIVVIGIYLGFKREFSKLIGFLVIALIAVGLVFNAGGVKDVLLELFNRIIGASPIVKSGYSFGDQPLFLYSNFRLEWLIERYFYGYAGKNRVSVSLRPALLQACGLV